MYIGSSSDFKNNLNKVGLKLSKSEQESQKTESSEKQNDNTKPSEWRLRIQ